MSSCKRYYVFGNYAMGVKSPFLWWNQQKSPWHTKSLSFEGGPLCKWWRSHRCNGRSTNEAFQASVFCWREELVCISFFCIVQGFCGSYEQKVACITKINLPLIVFQYKYLNILKSGYIWDANYLNILRNKTLPMGYDSLFYLWIKLTFLSFLVDICYCCNYKLISSQFFLKYLVLTSLNTFFSSSFHILMIGSTDIHKTFIYH